MDTNNAPSSTPAKKNIVLAVVAYLGILVIIPLLASGKDDGFVRFHVRQGLVLLALEIVLWLLGMFLWQLAMFIGILNLGVIILIIIGIVTAAQGKEKELPLVGAFAKYFTFA